MPSIVSFRPVTGDDLPLLFEHQLDPEAIAMAAFPARDRAAFDAHFAKIMADPKVVVRAIIEGGKLAGYIGSWEQDGMREVGYWIGRDHWGRGVATAALRALLNVVPFRPIYAHVAVSNVGSVRVLEKCAFERLTTAPGAPGPRGEPVDEHLYVLRT